MIGRCLLAPIVTKTAPVDQKAGAPIGGGAGAGLVIGPGREEPCDSLLLHLMDQIRAKTGGLNWWGFGGR